MQCNREKFKEVYGRVIRIADQQHVTLELFRGCLVATAYIPKEVMMSSEKK